MFNQLATSSPSLSAIVILKQSFFGGVGTWGAFFLIMMPGQFLIMVGVKKWQSYKAKHPTIVR